MIAAIESASGDQSVALASADGSLIALDGWTADGRQGSQLLPRLLELLTANRRSLTEVGALAVGIGPGSFTGLRVGLGLAKGLAMALQGPIVGVPSLAAWLAAEPEAQAAAARAGAREAYLLVRGEATPRIVDRDALAAQTGTSLLVAPAELAAAFGLPTARPPTRAAAEVARMAADRLARNQAGDDLARLEPTYLRAPRGVTQLPAGEAIEWR